MCGGSKIKLKIKACPESPSAPCGLVGRGGVAAAPPLQPRRGRGAGWVFVRLSSRPARPLPGPLPRPAPQALRPPLVDQRSMGPGGRQGQGKIKGVPRDRCGLLGQKQRRRDGETETLRLGWRPPDIKTGWCGAPETWGHRERERHGEAEMGHPGARTVRGRHAGKGAEQEGVGAQQDPGRGTERGEVAGRDLEMAETRACMQETRGGAWEQGPERRSHGSSL